MGPAACALSVRCAPLAWAGGIVDGVSPSYAVAKLTHQRIKTYAAQTPTVYAVAHDPETGARIAERTVIDAGQLEVIAQ